MTKHEAAIIMAYTGIAMLRGNDLDEYYKYISEIMGRTVFTHEITSVSEIIKEKSKPDFIKLCESLVNSER